MIGAREIEAIDDLVRHAARTHVMPRFRSLSTDAIRAKSGPLDLVTDADEAAEDAITLGLRHRFDGCAVVGEEAATRDKTLIATLRDADLAFTIDPIDGTANFAAGVPLFGCMVAVIRRGETVAAIIHDPVSDTSSLALRGEGAWERDSAGDRTDLRVAPPVPLHAMSGAASWRYLPAGLRRIVLNNLEKLAQIWDFRCAAHEHRMNAAGKCHFLLFNRLLPWDHLPGVLLHAEAGGYSARFDGSAYVPGMTSGGLICAPDRDSYEMLREALLREG